MQYYTKYRITFVRVDRCCFSYIDYSFGSAVYIFQRIHIPSIKF